jgi:hypothetical protein
MAHACRSGQIGGFFGFFFLVAVEKVDTRADHFFLPPFLPLAPFAEGS